MASLTPLSDHSDISVILIIFFHSVWIFLCFRMMSNFCLFKPGMCGYFETLGLIKHALLADFFWLCSVRGVRVLPHYCQVGAEIRISHPALLTPNEGRCSSVLLGWGRSSAFYQARTGTSLSGRGRGTSILPHVWSPLTPRGGEWPLLQLDSDAISDSPPGLPWHHSAGKERVGRVLLSVGMSVPAPHRISIASMKGVHPLFCPLTPPWQWRLPFTSTVYITSLWGWTSRLPM